MRRNLFLRRRLSIPRGETRRAPLDSRAGLNEVAGRQDSQRKIGKMERGVAGKERTEQKDRMTPIFLLLFDPLNIPNTPSLDVGPMSAQIS